MTCASTTARCPNGTLKARRSRSSARSQAVFGEGASLSRRLPGRPAFYHRITARRRKALPITKVLKWQVGAEEVKQKRLIRDSHNVPSEISTFRHLASNSMLLKRMAG